MGARELLDTLGLLDDTYPGSKEKRKVNHVEADEPLDLGTPWVLKVQGVDVEFFPISVLAAALNRTTGTIRMWEATGILPTSGFTKPGKDRDPRGKRRLWTRAQIEGIVQIAIEEGIWQPGPRINVTRTRFTERVTALFEQLRKEGIR